MSSGLAGIECSLTGHAELAELAVKDVAAIIRVLKWLIAL
jgi:hypothetical protein